MDNLIYLVKLKEEVQLDNYTCLAKGLNIYVIKCTPMIFQIINNGKLICENCCEIIETYSKVKG